MPRKQFYDYKGTEISIRFEPKRCIHAAECVRGLPGVFERDRRPWVEPDQGSAQEVVDVVARCPTGALQAEMKDGRPVEPSLDTNTARVVAKGPIFLEGRLELQLADGSRLSERRLALCRCGESRNKPFCDNSHLQSGFSDSGVLGVVSPAPLPEEASGSLELSTASNGPILFRGRLQVIGTEGSDPQERVKGSLCRCGASQNKPYCDGLHRAAEFKAD